MIASIARSTFMNSKLKKKYSIKMSNIIKSKKLCHHKSNG